MQPDRYATTWLPRGGPAASWLDRLYETDATEYLDRAETTSEERARILAGLERLHRLSGDYLWMVRRIAALVGDRPEPRIIEFGAGSGELSRRLLARLPTARVTVSEFDPSSVVALRDSDLGSHDRARVARADITRVNAPDQAWDLAVFAFSVHHLAPYQVAAALAEGTRIARALLIIDVWRSPLLLASAPLFLVMGGTSMAHDGVISLRRMYSRDAMRHLAEHCGAPVAIATRFQPPAHVAHIAMRLDPTPATSAPNSGGLSRPEGG